MKEPLIRIEDVLNGKYRYVEGRPVRRSYVDMENIGIENMSELKYKVGDKVRIKSLDWYNTSKNKYGVVELIGSNGWGFKFLEEMSAFCGEVMTISNIGRSDCGYYDIKEDNGVYFWTDEMIECKVEEETKSEPKFKVDDKITNGKTIFTIVALSSDKYIVENSFEGYSMLHFKNQDEWEIMEEENLDLKFKTGDRVFNKVTRKWVNIIEFDIETGLYIVRYDDGIQGRSLESELCETRPSFKEIKEVVKKKAEVYINSKTELDGLSKPLLYEGFVDGMMTALIEMEE